MNTNPKNIENKPETDYEQFIEEVTIKKRSNELFDNKFVEFEEFCIKNYKKQKREYITELHKRLEDLKSISKHGLFKLLIKKDLFPFIRKQRLTNSEMRFHTVILNEYRIVMRIVKISKKENESLRRLIDESKNQNFLIGELESYINLKYDNSKIYNEYSDIIKGFESFLKRHPRLSKLIDNSLRERSNIGTNRLMKMKEENDENIVNLYNQKMYKNAISQVKKYPHKFDLLFPFWEDLAQDFDFYHKTGKRKGKIYDSEVIKWILNLTGYKFIDHTSPAFKKVQKRWTDFKNSKF